MQTVIEVDMRIAIIGGIGSGKSEVLAVARELGFPTLSADEINSALLGESEYVKKIDKAFPGVVEDGTVNKAKLSAEVFSCKEKRLLLNSIAHPEILRKIDECDSDPLVVELPLAVESGMLDCFDEVVLVSASRRLRYSRLEGRGVNKKRARAIIHAQAGERSLKKVATRTIENNGDIDTLRRASREILRLFCE